MPREQRGQLTDFPRYIADYVFALPTVAFFMCAIGIFIIGHAVSQILGYRRFRGPRIWQKLIASIRYLSYRGFHVKSLQWNSAPVGILLLGLAGTIFFFCKLRIEKVPGQPQIELS
jgi:MFS superfamily sulfate permease-like transporter